MHQISDIYNRPCLTDLSTIRPTLAPRRVHGERARRCLKAQHTDPNQMLAFKAATGKAFTTVLAGFAFTICILPKISRVPAFVAGLTRVLILQRPGTMKTPAAFTCAVATVARVSRSFVHCDFFTSVAVASASASAPFVMAFAFIAGAFIAGAIFQKQGRLLTRRPRSKIV